MEEGFVVAGLELVRADVGVEVLGGDSKDVWHALFEAALEQSSNGGGLVPYWLFPLEDGAYIERHVPALPLSRDASQLEALKRSLAVYRMVFGQPRQDDLMTFLMERCSPEVLRQIEPLLRIDLSPSSQGKSGTPGRGDGPPGDVTPGPRDARACD